MPTLSSQIARVVPMIGVLLAACVSPTAVEALAVSLRGVTFATGEEAAAWPSRPEIFGGETLVVRGRTYVGCRDLRANAVRRGDLVGVEITAVGPDRICPAVVSWIAFEATVVGLAPATYRVRVEVAGMEGRVEDTVAVTTR